MKGEPNIQGIPISTPEGRRTRRAFAGRGEGMRTEKEVRAMRKTLQSQLDELERTYRERWAEARKKDMASPGFVPAVDVIGEHEQLFDVREEARKNKLRTVISVCDWVLGRVEKMEGL